MKAIRKAFFLVLRDHLHALMMPKPFDFPRYIPHLQYICYYWAIYWPTLPCPIGVWDDPASIQAYFDKYGTANHVRAGLTPRIFRADMCRAYIPDFQDRAVNQDFNGTGRVRRFGDTRPNISTPLPGTSPARAPLAPEAFAAAIPADFAQHLDSAVERVFTKFKTESGKQAKQILAAVNSGTTATKANTAAVQSSTKASHLLGQRMNKLTGAVDDSFAKLDAYQKATDKQVAIQYKSLKALEEANALTKRQVDLQERAIGLYSDHHRRPPLAIQQPDDEMDVADAEEIDDESDPEDGDDEPDAPTP